MPADSHDAFHAHLDVCRQCENNPFALCPIGAAALKKAVEDGARALRLDVLGKKDE